MENCIGCGCLKEFERDRFCQKCEGIYAGQLSAENVRYEVLFMARKLNISPQSRRMIDYKTLSRERWRKQALDMIDINTFQNFYQNFMKTFSNLTEEINFTSKKVESIPEDYADQQQRKDIFE